MRRQLQNALHENLGQCGRYELLRPNPLFKLRREGLRTCGGRERAIHSLLSQQFRKRHLPLMRRVEPAALRSKSKTETIANENYVGWLKDRPGRKTSSQQMAGLQLF